MKKRNREDTFPRGPSATFGARHLDLISLREFADLMIELNNDRGLVQLGYSCRSGELLAVFTPFYGDDHAFCQTFFEVPLAVHSISLAILYNESTTLRPTLT